MSVRGSRRGFPIEESSDGEVRGAGTTSRKEGEGGKVEEEEKGGGERRTGGRKDSQRHTLKSKTGS